MQNRRAWNCSRDVREAWSEDTTNYATVDLRWNAVLYGLTTIPRSQAIWSKATTNIDRIGRSLDLHACVMDAGSWRLFSNNL